MGLLGAIFSGILNMGNKQTSSKSWASANRFNQAKGGHAGGWAAIAFGNIINADSGADELIDEFGLDQPDCEYCNAYNKAYGELYAQAQMEAAAENMMLAFAGGSGDMVDPEDLLDMEEVDALAYEYASVQAEQYIAGEVWIPEAMLNWAFYDVSSHND